MTTFVDTIDDRGWTWTLSAPLIESSEQRSQTLQQAADAFDAFRPVMRPLAVEIQFCFWEAETGLPSGDVDWPRPWLMKLVDTASVGRVTARTLFAGPAEERAVSAIDRSALLSSFAGVVPAVPNRVLGFRTIVTEAVALRTSVPATSILLKPWGREFPAFEPGWFAGPHDTAGWGAVPPAQLTLDTQWGRISLELIVHWTHWLRRGSPERAAFEAGLRQLKSKGWE